MRDRGLVAALYHTVIARVSAERPNRLLIHNDTGTRTNNIGIRARACAGCRCVIGALAPTGQLLAQTRIAGIAQVEMAYRAGRIQHNRGWHG